MSNPTSPKPFNRQAGSRQAFSRQHSRSMDSINTATGFSKKNAHSGRAIRPVLDTVQKLAVIHPSSELSANKRSRSVELLQYRHLKSIEPPPNMVGRDVTVAPPLPYPPAEMSVVPAQTGEIIRNKNETMILPFANKLRDTSTQTEPEMVEGRATQTEPEMVEESATQTTRATTRRQRTQTEPKMVEAIATQTTRTTTSCHCFRSALEYPPPKPLTLKPVDTHCDVKF